MQLCTVQEITEDILHEKALKQLFVSTQRRR